MTRAAPSDPKNAVAFDALQRAQDSFRVIAGGKKHYEQSKTLIMHYHMAQAAYDAYDLDQLAMHFGALEKTMRDDKKPYEMRVFGGVLANELAAFDLLPLNMTETQFDTLHGFGGVPFHHRYAEPSQDGAPSFKDVTIGLIREGAGKLHQAIAAVDGDHELSQRHYNKIGNPVHATAALLHVGLHAFTRNAPVFEDNRNAYAAFADTATDIVSALTQKPFIGDAFSDDVALIAGTAAKANIKLKLPFDPS